MNKMNIFSGCEISIPVVTFLGYLSELEENWLHSSTKNHHQAGWLKRIEQNNDI